MLEARISTYISFWGVGDTIQNRTEAYAEDSKYTPNLETRFATYIPISLNFNFPWQVGMWGEGNRRQHRHP